MTVLLIVVAVVCAWLVIAVVLALLIGRAVRIADRQHARDMRTRAANRSTTRRAPARPLASVR